MAGRHHVLICEDEHISLMALEMLFTDEGYDVTAASDGQMAVEALQERPVDLILTDLQVPRIEGRELIQNLRRLRPAVPIIVVTGRPPEEGEAALDGTEGDLMLLKKPVDANRLIAEVARLLDRGAVT